MCTPPSLERFIQLGHGNHSLVERLSPGDWIPLCSPRTSSNGGESLQAFTAIGRVAEGARYEFDQAREFSMIGFRGYTRG
jgi:hypothetical protein